MHYFIYEAYRKRFKKGFFSGLNSLPLTIKVSLGIWFIINGISFIFIIAFPYTIGRIIFAFIPVIASIILDYISTGYYRKTIDTRMNERKRRVRDLKKWLNDDMKINDPNMIEHLHNRMQVEVEKRKRTVDKVEDYLFRIFQTICFPIVLVVFTRFLQMNETDFMENVIMGTVIVIFVLIIVGVALYFLYCAMTKISKNQIYNYQTFTDDLEEILKFDFYDEHEDEDTEQ